MYRVEGLKRLVFERDHLVYDRETCLYVDIASIVVRPFQGADTAADVSAPSVPDIEIVLERRDGTSMTIAARKPLVGKVPRHELDALHHVYDALCEITFTHRMEAYEARLETDGWVEIGAFRIHRVGGVTEGGRVVADLADPDLAAELSPFDLRLKSHSGVLKRAQTTSARTDVTIPIGRDRDCFIYLMKHYFGLTWPREAVRSKLGGRMPSAKPTRVARLAGTEKSMRDLFVEAVFRLAVTIFKSDGRISADEIDRFRAHFSIGAGEIVELSPLLETGPAITNSVEEEAERLVGLLGQNNPLLEHVLIGLLGIATADGLISEGEHALIGRAAKVFGKTSFEFEQLASVYMSAYSPRLTEAEIAGGRRTPASHRSVASYFSVLGLTEGATWDQVRESYRTLVRRYHPDTLRAQNMPQETIDVAEEMLKSVNMAYSNLERHFMMEG